MLFVCLTVFFVDNSRRWRVVRFDVNGNVSFWDVCDTETDARNTARAFARFRDDGSRWDAFCLSFSDEQDVAFGRTTLPR